MKEARYLIRLSSPLAPQPSAQSNLLNEVRALSGPIKGKAINLRISPFAIEFDLFCAPETDTSLFKDAFASLGPLVTCKRLDVPPPAVEPQATIGESRQLFNEHRFWEVHEVLEGLWKMREGSEKQLVQGLILMAAALVHAQKNEEEVMWKMMADALKRLEGQPDAYYGWNIREFRDHFTRVLAAQKLNIPTV